jgi:hypothetical protein
MVQVRRGAALLTVISAAVALVSCSTETTGSATSAVASTAASTSVSAAPGFDVSRLNQLSADFPPGFVAGPPSVPLKIGQQVLPSVGAVATYGEPFTVDPAKCRPLLKPVDGQLGSDSMHIRGVESDQTTISLGAENPVTVPAEIPSAGCERFAYTVDEAEHHMRGTVERLEAPEIEGAMTIALRYDVEGFPNVEYSYAAILDGRVYVDVQARLAPDFQAEPVLSALLVRAVAAVRGD